MNKYTLEIIEVVGVYYPTRHVITVEAENLDLKGALDKCFDSLNYGYDIPDDYDLNSAKEDCMNEWGLNEDDDKLIALAYNKCLDDAGSSYRIIKGYEYDYEISDDINIFDLMDTDTEEIKL